MIIYGSRSSHIKSVQLQNETCSHCNTQGSVLLSTHARYTHIFWIPLFSLGRTSVSQCQHCKQVLELKQMPAQIRAHHERTLTETRLPLWQFTGLALLLVFIAFSVYADRAKQEEQARFLKNPEAGDVYEYKTKEGHYTLFKINEVRNDTVIVRFNDYEVDRISGLHQINMDQNYSDSTYSLTKAELTEMFAAGNIADINRNDVKAN